MRRRSCSACNWRAAENQDATVYVTDSSRRARRSEVRSLTFPFLGADTGRERAEAIHSLICTAKLNGLDPEPSLRHVLERTAQHPTNRIEELLPCNLAVSNLDAQSETT
jgi:hypothetical protein